MNSGFVITAKGWDLIGRAVADSNDLELMGVTFGNGKMAEEDNPALFEKLVAQKNGGVFVDGTTSNALVESSETGTTISFICEYRSDFQGETGSSITGAVESGTETWPCDISSRFYIQEFGVWAKDPDTLQPVLIYYATLGDTPHPVEPYGNGAIDIRRYPVSIAVSEAPNVTLSYPPLAFVTDEWLHRVIDFHHENHCMPDVLRAIQQHDESPDAHLGLRGYVRSNDDRIRILEELLGGEGVNFKFNLETLEGMTGVAGSYNPGAERITF